MAENTLISWAHDTFNPWEGCTRISPACDNCYAAERAHRFGNDHLWAGHLRRTSPANWRKPLKWNREAAATGKPRRVFCASLADVFDNQAPQAWRDDLWALIEATPHLTWMLLTKRPQKIVGMVPPAWLIQPPTNVWYGTTVEDQTRANQRISHLLRVPAALRFLSCEPLLGPVDLTMIEFPNERGKMECYDALDLHLVDGEPMSPGTCDGTIELVIAGGESGPKARAPHPLWFRALRDQCVNAGKPFHLKQWGEWALGSPPVRRIKDLPGSFCRALSITIDGRAYDGDRLHQFRDGTTMVRVGKQQAGRRLDGVIHDAMPGEPDPNDCRVCRTDLSNPSAAGAEDGVCGPCIEEMSF